MHLLSFFILLLLGLLFCCKKYPTKQTNQNAVLYTAQPTHNDTIYTPLPWLSSYDITNKICNAIPTPLNYTRKSTGINGFDTWLRNLPIRKDRNTVLLFNGLTKLNQSAHFAILHIDVGNEDIQQCADAVIRLRSEYLFHTKQFDKIAFHYTSGHVAKYTAWREGMRPSIKGNDVQWSKKATYDASYKNFKNYLRNVFMYCGSLSLSKELIPISNIHDIEPGDIFIKGGTPGHAAIVLDVAVHKTSGKKIFMLAQSYMPAQDIHILQNPNDKNLSPWYSEEFGDQLVTPEYTFEKGQLMRFKISSH